MSSGLLAEVVGPDGLIIIAALALVILFGGSKLPKLARGLGSASHEFRKGIAEGEGRRSPPHPADLPAAVDEH